MNISAKVIEDTIAANGRRLTTLELKYPKFIHGELMTHRVFSRNASSSRAVPTAKLLRLATEEPATPVEWGKNQKGMQAREVLTGKEAEAARMCWMLAGASASAHAQAMLDLGVHKQVANRIIEPYSHIHVVVTSTEWGNFFGLRCDPDAQPEMQELGWSMADAYFTSEPRRPSYTWVPTTNDDPMKLQADCWHLPYTGLEERMDLGLKDALKASTARCARVSYILHSGEATDIHKDRELHDSLFEVRHMSPFEHQGVEAVSSLEQSRNFRGFHQYRAFIPQDTREFDYLEACKRAGREPKHEKKRWWE